MKAVRVTGSEASPKFTLDDSLPKSDPKVTEMFIKVHAAGITGHELTWPELYARQSRIPGHEISGVVAQLGPGYHGELSVGDDVAAMLRNTRGAGQAEYAVASADEVARKPASLSYVEAAALPIPLLTAWQAVFEQAKIKHRAKVLVTGASGAVGVMLVQLASRLLDAKVVALAATRHHELLLQLGASEVIDYGMSEWKKFTDDVDAVFDTVGGEILVKTWATVESNGVIVTVGDPPPAWAFGRARPDKSSRYPNVKCVHFIMSPQSDTLAKALEYVDRGTLSPLKIKAFPVEKAAEAWGYANQRGRDGKAVLEFVSYSQ